MSLEERKFKGEDARILLENRLLKNAFKAVGEAIEAMALGCNPDDRERAQRIIISKQLLVGIEREIKRVVEDGEIATVQLDELKRKGILAKFCR